MPLELQFAIRIHMPYRTRFFNWPHDLMGPQDAMPQCIPHVRRLASNKRVASEFRNLARGRIVDKVVIGLMVAFADWENYISCA